MITKLQRFGFFLTAFWLATACTSISTGSECSMDAELVKEFDTYAWLPTDSILIMENVDFVTQEMISRIRGEIEVGFMESGYKLIEDAELADFVISATLTMRRQQQGKVYFPLASNDFTDRIKPGDLNLKMQIMGILTVDAYDGDTGEPFFRAWAERPLDFSDRELPRRPIQQAVTTIIAQFPHR